MDEHRRENVRKLEVGLPYLLNHNREARQDGVADDLQNVLELSLRITGYFEAALDKLKHDE